MLPAPLIRALCRQFAGQTVGVKAIENYVITSTPYAANQYNQQALAPMEREGLIEVVDDERKKRFTYPPGTKIRFV